MKITIISLGKIKESYFKDSINEYLKRLNAYTNLSRIELPDEKILDSKTDSLIKEKEAKSILKVLNMNSFKIALTETGKNLTSPEFASFMSEIPKKGYSEISFIIGGALGLDNSVLNSSDYSLSLSKMTFPHQMAYLFLAEQIYRSFKIINNEPYHKI